MAPFANGRNGMKKGSNQNEKYNPRPDKNGENPLLTKKQRREQIRSLGNVPSFTCLASMSLRVNPSLSAALQFAHRHSSGQIKSELAKTIWGVYMRSYASMDDAYLAFTARMKSLGSTLQNSLYLLHASTLESTSAGLEQSLDKANSTAIEGTKECYKQYSSRLQGPTMMLFALGVLMPLIIGAMMPMMSLGSLNFSTENQNTGAQTGSSESNIFIYVLLMNVVFPASAFLLARTIIGKRPRTEDPDQTQSGSHTGKRKSIVFPACLTSAIMFSGFFISYILSTSGQSHALLLALPAIAGIGLAISFVFIYFSRRYISARKCRRELEAQFPEALYQVGVMMANGVPLERAFQKAASAMPGTDIARLFGQISIQMSAKRKTLHEILFARGGILNEVESSQIRATMKTVVAICDKDPESAGRAVMSISGYLRDIDSLDKEITKQLSNTVSMMHMTAAVLAPLVLGITTGLYSLIAHTLPAGSQGGLVPEHIFCAILGVYLIMTVLISTYYCSGIDNGPGKREFMNLAGRTLPVSMSVFLVSSWLATITL